MESLSREEKKQLAREDTSVDLLIQLSKEDSEIRRLVAANSNTPLQVLESLGVGYADEIVSNPVFDLLWLESSDSQFLKMCLAKAATTPPDVLEKLSCDRDVLISVLERLANSSDWLDRKTAAENIQTPLSILQKLQSDRDRYVRISAAKNIER